MMKKIGLLILILLVCNNTFAEMEQKEASRYGTMIWGTSVWGDPNIFKFGEEIPLENMQGNTLNWDDINWGETILPSPHVIKIAHAKKLITGDIGNFTIHWTLANGVKFTREYETDDTPAKAPVILYYNTDTKAPQVDVSKVPRRTFYYNSLVSEPPYDPKDEDPDKIYMYIGPQNITVKGPDDITPTYIILQCDDFTPQSENDFLGIEIIQIKEFIPDVPDGEVDVGSRLLPYIPLSDPDVYSGVYARILSGMEDTDQEKNLIYQHNVENSPQNKYVWSIGENSNPANMTIIWMRKGIRDVEWPYEYRQYTSQWPLDSPEKYQLYVRGDETVQGPDVRIPSDLNPGIYKQTFISPFHEASVDSSGNEEIFTTNGAPGWVLLKYETGPEPGRYWVGFEVIRCELHDDIRFFNLDPTDWEIGKEIEDSYHKGYTSPHFIPGYIHIPEGDACDKCDRYAPAIYDQDNGGTGQIFAVNEGILEIWWYNLSRIQDPEGTTWPDWPENLRVLWPSKVMRYNAVWPEQSQSIIIAKQSGTGVIEKSQYGDEWDLYYQNDSSQHGFNPNEEHAAKYPYKTGMGIFPLRNDLNIPESSEPYVLMKYKEQPDNQLWRFELYQVFDEKDTFLFQDWPTHGASLTITTELFEQIQSDAIFNINPDDDERQMAIRVHAKNILEIKIKDKKFEEVATLKKTIINNLAIIPKDITATYNEEEFDKFVEDIIKNPDKYYQPIKKEILPFQTAALKYIPETDPYEKVAGFLIQPPFPISTFPYCDKNEGVSGNYYEDRKNNHWFFAAGDDGKTSEVKMQFYYPNQPEYYFPKPTDDSQIPLLANGDEVPITIVYTVFWPETPEMNINQTLIHSMNNGLPAIKGQESVDILYQQSIKNDQGDSVILIDPSQTRSVTLEAIPDDIITESKNGEKLFIGSMNSDERLSLSLRERISYDPVNQELKFKGKINKPVSGNAFVYLNVMSKSESEELLALSEKAGWKSAINTLYAKTKEPICINDSNTDIFNDLALSSGFAMGTGYVTLIMQNKDGLGDLPVSLEIIKVVEKLDPGFITVIKPDCPFDETLTLRHSGDFGGRPDDFNFEWEFLRVSYDESTTNNWDVYNTNGGKGAIEITIKGPGLFTLSDNYFRCRYKYEGTEMIVQGKESDWTKEQLAEGWIKRVIGDINPYEQRAKGGGIEGAEKKVFEYNKEIDTIVSMISQIGQRWEGNIPMNCTNIDDYGLLEIYETVSKRGKDLSINYGFNYPPANDALLLVASRISNFYMLLGNEAYADASDPTIGFGTDDGIYGQEASSIHCFMNMVPTLLDEELALLRGRNDDLSPGVRMSPVYNRLFWNFTKETGEVAYALNYNILDVDSNGVIDEADAKQLYPQGHGDAWGHYLSAIKIYYQLLTHPNYSWNARSERILLGGIPVVVDYLDEQKFAEAAAAKARTGAEIVNLTYRKHFLEDPESQWQGYKDTDTERAWGFAEWASRTGQGAYIDWVVGNAILPDKDDNPAHTGVEKIDRTTVLGLHEVTSHFIDIQEQVDAADIGLSPLGLATNVLPFDIDPAEIDKGNTHFEQIYQRAVNFLNNAIAVFDHAVNATQMLRRQADSLKNFQDTVKEREVSFNNQLIEIFGYPYPDDIGVPGEYEADYNGPDIHHYMYIDPSPLVGDKKVSVYEYKIPFKELNITANGDLLKTEKEVVFHLSATNDRFGFVKPPHWKGERRATGEIQMVRSDLIQARARFERALEEYNQLILQIENQAQQLQAKYNMNQDEINILNEQLKTQISLNDSIKQARKRQLIYRKMAQFSITVGNALAEAPPKSIIAGLCGGGDMTSILRSTIKRAGSIVAEVFNTNADKKSLEELDHQHTMQELQTESNIKLTGKRHELEIKQQLDQLGQIVRQEVSKRIEIYTLQEALHQTSGRYLSVLARGQRLLAERDRFRSQTAGNIQARRYKDMAFRIFRNEALQKYRSQFDIAARYVYLAAKAYDYETTLLSSESVAGKIFLTDIIRKRLIGTITNGIPHTGSGLADPMKRMAENFKVIKSGLGFLTPEQETNRFSLRRELFRIQNGYAGNKIWRETLHQHVVNNLLDIPEFQQYARIFTPVENIEPGIVIPFSTTIHHGLNFFGWPLGGGDNTYNSSNYTTKIRSIGVWFSNFNNLSMANTPFVYLIPTGNDIMRSPTDASGEPRIFKVLDQKIPLPFPIGDSDLDNPDWLPIPETASEYAAIRKYSSFRAYHDSGQFNTSEIHRNSRLIGRSVWNTRWLLIIPAGSFHSDRDEGLKRFIDGSLQGDQRDGNGVSDIKLFFETYSISGNKK
jgi:hypothetical protein